MDASYLSQQVNAIIVQLHGLFDEIGVSNHEREKREEELFHALSDALHNQVRLVTNEKQDMLDEAQSTINAIRQMETSLDDSRSRRDYENDDDLQVTYPLSRCLQVLKEKHMQISKIHRERFEQVRKLVEALESYSLHLESSFVRLALPPTGPNQSIPINFDLSPSYVDKLDAEFTRVYEEYARRVATVKALAENIIQLWAELGTPQAQTDGAIVKNYRDAPEQLGLHEEDLARLRSKRDKLAEEKRTRERRLKELKAQVEDLWEKLGGVEESEKKAFLNSNRGCGLRQINEFEDELARLHELKRQNLPAFVEDARCQLQALWDKLYLSEDEMLEFTPAFSDVYSDALLEAHEREIARLEALRQQRAPTLAMVDKHHGLIHEREELAASSQDASRLMMRGQKGEKRDPGKLLREEKTRKRIAKELPKVTAELRKVLEAWEDEYGRPFLVHGERYLDTVYEQDQQQSARAAGPRSRTPACPPMSAAKSATRPTPGRNITSASTVSAASIVRPPTRTAGAKTPTAGHGAGGGTLRRHAEPPASAAATTTATAATTAASAARSSPSRIPMSSSRAPLGSLKHGMNSPERPRAGGNTAAAPNNGGAALRSGQVLMRAPPPKMRDLVHVPELETPANPYRGTNLQSSGMHVRHMDPEDVYDDREMMGTESRAGSRAGGNNSRNQPQPSQYEYNLRQQSYQLQQQHLLQQQQQQQQQRQPHYAKSDRTTGHSTAYSQASASSVPSQATTAITASSGCSVGSSSVSGGSVRHISNTSTIVSESENWETYDDNSEPEVDASDTYYAKMRAAQSYNSSSQGNGTKRMSPENGRPTSSMAKRIRGLPPPAMSVASVAGPYAGHMLADADGNRIMSGSEWTDEEAF